MMRRHGVLLLLIAVWLVALPASGRALGTGLSFNDPLHGQQWYLRAMRFDAAWALLQAQQAPAEPVVIAVLDTGFDVAHPDLDGQVLAGFNIADGSDEVAALTSHGTGTIGPLGAVSDNALGISQAAWTARVMPVRVTNRPDGRARTADIAAGIRRAADAGAQVINVSFGGVQLDSIDAAAKYAQSRGAVVIMPAGNDGRDQRRWRRQPHIFAVAALTREGRRASYSNFGPFVDFAAPGHRIISLYPDGRYARWNGTSFASPLVAAAAALVLSANPELSPEQVYATLRHAADNHDAHQRDGLPGMIDVARAVELALATQGHWRPTTGDAMRPVATSAEDAALHAPAKEEEDGETERLQSPQGFVVERLELPHGDGL